MHYFYICQRISRLSKVKIHSIICTSIQTDLLYQDNISFMDPDLGILIKSDPYTKPGEWKSLDNFSKSTYFFKILFSTYLLKGETSFNVMEIQVRNVTFFQSSTYFYNFSQPEEKRRTFSTSL